ncbi:uncharacterized protein DS421_12g361700 [Arachis hypogaea]|nr:uncharacterized protein DS421_12g361700 [Arachis hypogaea]
MARTKNTKRARVEGESSASARLVASSHYMARWLPCQRALKKLCGEVRVKANCSSQHLIDFVQTRLDYYLNLVRPVYSTLNYVVPEPDEEGEEVMPLIEFDLGSQHYKVTLQELAEQWNLVYHGVKFTGGIGADEEWGEYNRIVGLQSLQYENPQMDARGYACHWTKIFTWLGIDLSEEKSVVLSNVAKIDDSTLRQMGRDPNAHEPQVQGEPQDPEVQAQSQEPPQPSPPSPTMQDLMDEL